MSVVEGIVNITGIIVTALLLRFMIKAHYADRK